MSPQIKYYLLWCLIVTRLNAYAQIHQWANSFDSKVNTEAGAVDVDSLSNSYIVGTFKDTLKIGKQIFLMKDKRNNNDAYIAKFNKKGNLIWCKTIYCTYFTNVALPFINLNNIKILSNGRILIYGYFALSPTLFLSKNDSLGDGRTKPRGNAFVAIVDSSGKFINYYRLVKDIAAIKQSNYPGLLDIDKQNNPYILGNFREGSVYYSKKDSLMLYDPNPTIITSNSYLIKYTPGFDSISWYKDFSDSGRNNSSSSAFLIKKIRVGKDNNLYFASIIKQSAVVNNIRYTFQSKFVKGLFMVISPSGNFINVSLLNQDGNQQENLTDIAAIDTNRIYINGYVQDSITRNGKCYLSSNAGSSGKAFPFIGLISTSNKDKWINLTRNKDSLIQSSYFEQPSPGRLNFDRSGNIYCSFRLYYNTLSIGGLTDSSKGRNVAGFAKFDSLGNALWLRSTGTVNDMESDGQDLVYCGSFTDSLKLKPYSLKAKAPSGFIAKTFDYIISRNYVKSGPYCAGDTILVPYTKNGDYDSSNYFVAELSDENGYFEGKERVLGRVKTNKDSIVIGKLPLFHVASSGKYRIRIRSTNPVVQSFYKFDILRLLIYSRDKADPGPTETICMGDSIKLNTYGGTKWAWSPKYRMDDSTKRQPWAWPVNETLYKIIIADSSGCGEPDTAYKQVYVRPYPKSFTFGDTALCKNENLKIPVRFTGGDSIYSWQWFYINSPKSFFPMKKGNSKLMDTLYYLPSVTATQNEKLAIVLRDGCTSKADTAYLSISLRNQVKIKTKLRDTSMCDGNWLKYKPLIIGGVPKYYKYQWKDLISNTVLSTTDSLKFISSKSLKIQLIVNDGCEALGDTAVFNVTVKPPLKVRCNLRDTSLCFGRNISYTTTASGGTGTYSFRWFVDTIEVSKSDKYQLVSSNAFVAKGDTKILSIILEDNCSANDTIKKTIIVKPAPKANFDYDLACSRTPTKFEFTGTKPDSTITTAFNWNFNNEINTTLENPSHQFTIGTKKITLTLNSSNGCSDTLLKEIEVKLQSKADFTTTDVCETDSAVFFNKSLDATSYKWRFGDGKTSSKQNPKNKYKLDGVTRTFNVAMVALASGCSDSIVKAITINQNPDATFTESQNGNTIELKAKEGYSSYVWKFDNKDSITSSTANYTYFLKTWNPLSICLKATDNSGCIAESCKNIVVGFAKMENLVGYKIYPNPNNGTFTLELGNDMESAELEIYNSVGLLVFRFAINEKVTNINFDNSAGLYLIKTHIKGSVFIQKFNIYK